MGEHQSLEELREAARKADVLSAVCYKCEDNLHDDCLRIFPVNDGFVAPHFCTCKCNKALQTQEQVRQALRLGELPSHSTSGD